LKIITMLREANYCMTKSLWSQLPKLIV